MSGVSSEQFQDGLPMYLKALRPGGHVAGNIYSDVIVY